MATALVVVAGLSWQAQAETLALRCDGTKITIEIKEPDDWKEWSLRHPEYSEGEEDKGLKDARIEERASTDVIVADRVIYVFGTEFEIGYANDAFITFYHDKKTH
jgi:hypothetical protein